MKVVVEFLQKTKQKIGIIGNFMEFLWERKLWWMIPIFLILFLLGFILVMTQGSALAPFIYTLF